MTAPIAEQRIRDLADDGHEVRLLIKRSNNTPCATHLHIRIDLFEVACDIDDYYVHCVPEVLDQQAQKLIDICLRAESRGKPGLLSCCPSH